VESPLPLTKKKSLLHKTRGEMKEGRGEWLSRRQEARVVPAASYFHTGGSEFFSPKKWEIRKFSRPELEFYIPSQESDHSGESTSYSKVQRKEFGHVSRKKK